MVIQWMVRFFVTLGVGRIPFAPGTWGSLLAVVIWWAISPIDLTTQLAIIAVFTLFAWTMILFYERQQQRHDGKEIIVDEVVGQWIALVALPLTWQTMAIGFLLFRFFDILKPFPIGFIDRQIPGAFGTLCDDIVAGLLARVLLGYAVSTWMI